MVPCNSNPDSILASRTIDAGENIVMSNASKGAPVGVTASKTEVELRVAKQYWLRRKDI